MTLLSRLWLFGAASPSRVAVCTLAMVCVWQPENAFSAQYTAMSTATASGDPGNSMTFNDPLAPAAASTGVGVSANLPGSNGPVGWTLSGSSSSLAIAGDGYLVVASSSFFSGTITAPPSVEFAASQAPLYVGGSASGGATFVAPSTGLLHVVWSTPSDHNVIAGIGAQFPTRSGSAEYQFSAGSSINVGAQVSSGWSSGLGVSLAPPLHTNSISLTDTSYAAIFWSFNAVPGSDPAPLKITPISPHKHGFSPDLDPLGHPLDPEPDYYDQTNSSDPTNSPVKIIGGVDIANDVTGSYLTSFPAGIQGIGTDSYLHTSIDMSGLGGSWGHAGFASGGANYAAFTLPATQSHDLGPLLISYNGITRPFAPGDEINFLADLPGGVSDFRLITPSGALFGGDLNAAFKFANAADVTMVLTVPEPTTIALAAMGSAVLCLVALRRLTR